MPRPFPLLVALALLASNQAQAAPAQYVVDGAHTSVVFSVGHLGYSFTYGMFKEASGRVTLDPANPEGSRFELAVKVASISTGNEARDKHLMNADFFDAAKFPEITFAGQTQGVTRDDKGRDVYQVKGKLTMHGVTKEVTLPVRLLHAGEDQQGKARVGFHCDLPIKRSDYGMNNSIPAISDSVGVTFSFEAAAP